MGKDHGSLNVPIEHHPTIRYIVYNGYYQVMSNIPKMGQLPTPEDEANMILGIFVRAAWYLRLAVCRMWHFHQGFDFDNGSSRWKTPELVLILMSKLVSVVTTSWCIKQVGWRTSWWWFGGWCIKVCLCEDLLLSELVCVKIPGCKT